MQPSTTPFAFAQAALQPGQCTDDLNHFVRNLNMLLPLFDTLANVVFFIKDTEARYVLVNQTLIKRCGGVDVSAVLGKTTQDIFKGNLGQSYMHQDYAVLRQGLHITDKLELHSYNSGELGWCLTHKVPIYSNQNQIIGMSGISVDIQSEEVNHPHLNTRLEKVEAYIRQHFDQIIRTETLASISGLSTSFLERKFKNIFQMTPHQFIQKVRLEHAIHLLQQNLSITEISVRCGYTDHSAFSRKFKQLTGLSPTQFKQQYMRH